MPMSHDLYDRLFDYIESQKNQARLELSRTGANKEYLKGRLTAFLDLLSYLMTDGKLL